FSDLEIDSPYNTYKIDGLPPGPIASPGKAALEAALRPPAGPWLYYVLIDTNGKHGFATTGAEFNRLIAEAERKGVR
ncbi:MAG: endolytic transglycosylase MltG, partial [Acidimicrobiales bacterium]